MVDTPCERSAGSGERCRVPNRSSEDNFPAANEPHLDGLTFRSTDFVVILRCATPVFSSPTRPGFAAAVAPGVHQS
jgi:hypothetical protein